MPQMEQLEVRLAPYGGGWAGVASSPEATGVAWVAPLGPNCLLVEHTITPREDFSLTEEAVSDYACLCLATEDTAADMPSMVERPHSLLGGNAFSYLQSAGSIACPMGAGKTYASRSITLLPGYFAELESCGAGDCSALFEAFDQRWTDGASRAILATLRSLGPRPGTDVRPLLAASVERLVCALAAARSARDLAQRGSGSFESARLAAEARAHVEKNLAGDLSIEAVAAALYTGRSRLCAVFRAECGQGLAEYVRARRMDAAAELLATTSLPVAEVARRVGYPRASSFSATFARCQGMAPVTWRREHP